MDLDTEKFSFGHAVMVETGIFVVNILVYRFDSGKFGLLSNGQ